MTLPFLTTSSLVIRSGAATAILSFRGCRGNHSLWGARDKIQYRLVCDLGSLHRSGRSHWRIYDIAVVLAVGYQTRHSQGDQATPARDKCLERKQGESSRLILEGCTSQEVRPAYYIMYSLVFSATIAAEPPPFLNAERRAMMEAASWLG